jgi:hypothetical protein
MAGSVTPVSWDNSTNNAVIGPDLLKEMEEQMTRIRQNLKAAKDMQKNFADKNRVFPP